MEVKEVKLVEIPVEDPIKMDKQWEVQDPDTGAVIAIKTRMKPAFKSEIAPIGGESPIEKLQKDIDAIKAHLGIS